MIFENESVNAATVKYSGKSRDLNWSIDSNGLLWISGVGNYGYEEIEGTDILLPGWHRYRADIQSAKVDVRDITTTSQMFQCCENLKKLDVREFDTSKVTDMSYMFFNCKSLNSIDLSSFNTSNVMTMQMMFMGCSNLASINLSTFNTSNVTNMSGMFERCSSIKSLDLSRFDASKAVFMDGMFNGCDSLIKINTPKNVPENCDVSLNENYLDPNLNGTQAGISILPKNLPYSKELISYTYYLEQEVTTKKQEETTIKQEVTTEKPITKRPVIKPSKVKGLKVKNIKKKKIKVSWKWSSYVCTYGWQVQYARKRSFKSAKIKNVNWIKESLTLKNLTKNKTYYIRVRAWTKDYGVKRYGGWSTIEKVKIKK